MLTRNDIRIEREVGGFANVICKRCGADLGRVQGDPPEKEDTGDWMAQVRGEFDVMIAEHGDLCPSADH